MSPRKKNLALYLWKPPHQRDHFILSMIHIKCKTLHGQRSNVFTKKDLHCILVEDLQVNRHSLSATTRARSLRERESYSAALNIRSTVAASF